MIGLDLGSLTSLTGGAPAASSSSVGGQDTFSTGINIAPADNTITVVVMSIAALGALIILRK